MKKLAALLFFGGLFLYAIYPKLVATGTSEALVEAPVYLGSSDTWVPLELDLSPSQNPVRLRVEVEMYGDSSTTTRFFDLLARVEGPDGSIFDHEITITRSVGESNNPSSDLTRAFAILPDIAVRRSGEHRILITQKRDLPLNMKQVNVTVLTGGAAVDTSLQGYGLPLMLAGGALFFISRRLSKGGSKRARRKHEGRAERLDLPGQPPRKRSYPDEKPSDEAEPREADSIWTRGPKVEPASKAEASVPVEQPKSKKPKSGGIRWGRQPKKD